MSDKTILVVGPNLKPVTDALSHVFAECTEGVNLQWVHAATPEEAEAHLAEHNVDAAIVMCCDGSLQSIGDADNPMNLFVRSTLVPRHIPFGRLTAWGCHDALSADVAGTFRHNVLDVNTGPLIEGLISALTPGVR